MNKTVSHLTLSLVLSSPLFSDTKFKNNRFINIKANRFSQPFLYTFISNVQIDKSRFSNFLNQAIKIDEFSFLKNSKIFGKHEDYTDAGFTATNVAFDNCYYIDGNGGAFSSLTSVSLSNCLFQGCNAHKGGAFVYSTSLNAEYVSFFRSHAFDSGTFTCLSSDNHCDTNISLIEVAESTSQNLFGFFSVQTSGKFNFDRSNITLCKAIGSVGCFQVTKSSFTMKEVTFHSSRTDNHHGCGLIGSPSFCNIDRCVFIDCIHFSNVQTAGAALTFTNLPEESKMDRCAFRKCYEGHAHIVANSEGKPLIVSHTCMHEPSEPIYEPYSGGGSIVLIEGTVSDICPIIISRQDNLVAGFNEEWSMNVEVSDVTKISGPSLKVVIIIYLVVIALYMLISTIFRKHRSAFKGRREIL